MSYKEAQLQGGFSFKRFQCCHSVPPYLMWAHVNTLVLGHGATLQVIPILVGLHGSSSSELERTLWCLHLVLLILNSMQ